MKKQSNMLLKVTGIFMIIGGGVNIILGLIAIMGLGVLALALGSEAKMGLLIFGGILFLIGAVISLIAGIKGVKNAAIPEKAQTCITFGILTAAFTVLASVISMIGGKSLNFIGLLIGLLLPVIYLIGAFQNKNLIGIVEHETIAQ